MPPEMTPEEEFEKGQREGREREQHKTFLKMTSYTAATVVFFGVFGPLFRFELAVIQAVPLLGLFGRYVLLLFVMIAAIPAGLVWRRAGGDKLKAIEAWERKRDDF